MSLEQYKDANRKELWEILQIQVERIAELEKALATSFEFLSMSQTADYWFYENHKHLIKEQGE